MKKRSFLPGPPEGDEVVPVGALVGELVAALEPGYLPSHAQGHQRREEVVVAVPADTTCPVGVDLECLVDLAVRTEVLRGESTLAVRTSSFQPTLYTDHRIATLQ